MAGIGFSQAGLESFAAPGKWNDPDMLIVGSTGWGWGIKPSDLTPDEQYTHISLWALLSAPLLLGCDVTKLDDFTLNLLTNDEVIAIDQDSLGRQARRVSAVGISEIWAKPLEDGSLAVGLFNRSEIPETISVSWKDLGLVGPRAIHDVWRQVSLGVDPSGFSSLVPRHGVRLLKITTPTATTD
jgi:alpha-galactosidase